MKSVVKKISRKKTAFTIVELLTVMSIIIILISLLVPGLHMAKKYAKKVRQNTQFYNISQAIELFNAEEDGYPDSTVLAGPGGVTTGSHRLAEALLGRDLLGFDPFSTWNAGADMNLHIYGRGNDREIAASNERRRGPYLQLKNISAFQLAEVYDPRPVAGVYDGSNPDAPAPVITDIYTTKRVKLIGSGKTGKVGTPVLYFKADPSSQIFDPAKPANSIYNFWDNADLINLGPVVPRPGIVHHFTETYTEIDPASGMTVNGKQLFYKAITNPQVRPQVRPYNNDSYILMSAGYDGLFGTKDDIYNFSN